MGRTMLGFYLCFISVSGGIYIDYAEIFNKYPVGPTHVSP